MLTLSVAVWSMCAFSGAADDEDVGVVRKRKLASRVVDDEDGGNGDAPSSSSPRSRDSPPPKRKAPKTRVVREDSESEGDDVHAAHTSDEEESDGEITEADRRFVVDDENEDDDEDRSRHRKKKKKKQRRTPSMRACSQCAHDSCARTGAELVDEDDDRELVEENMGLRQPIPDRPSRNADDVAGALFADDARPSASRNDADDEDERPTRRSLYDDGDESDDSFIEHDEDDEVDRSEKRARRATSQSFLADLGIVDPAQLEEWAGIFGNIDEIDAEIAARGPGETADEAQQPSLTEIIEPAVLAAKHFTAEDDRIRSADVPERIQLAHPPRAAPDDSELEQEAFWIAETAKIGGIHDRSTVRTAVKHVLRFLRQHLLETPFIYAHRQCACSAEGSRAPAHSLCAT